MNFKNWLILFFILRLINLQSQNTCNNPIQLCFSANSSISFPGIATGTAQAGPAYGCLLSQPAPTWFYIKTNATITNSVTQFMVVSSSNFDVDCIIWGPFASNTAFCSVASNSASIIDCSYSPASTETLTIPNTQPNQYYVIMVTNYSGVAQNINITCTKGGGNVFCPAGLPIADFSLSNSVICQGQSVSITDASLPAASITAWNYNCAAATPSSSTIQNPVLTFNTPGTHTISLTVGISSLMSTITKTIQVIPLPSLTVTPSNQTICAGKTATINIAGALNYYTNPGNITTPTYTINPIITTVYSISGTNAFGCSKTINDTVKVLSPPSIGSNVSSNTVCIGSSVTFSNSGGASYTLSPSSFTGNTINITPTVLGTTIFTVTGAGPFGCINTKTVGVTTYSLPVVNITPSNTTICSGKATLLSVSGANTYTWTTGSSLNVISVTPTVSTSYSVLGANSFGCKNSASSVVNVLNTPIVSINSPSTNVCFGYTMTVTANGASNYNWSTGATSNTLVVQPFSNSTYSIVGTNGGLCSDTAFLSLSVLPLPSVSASVSNTLACIGQSISLNASGTAGNIYYWQPINLLGQNQVVQILTPTTYTVYGQGANGCTFFSTAFVDVQNGNTVIPIATPSAVCIGDSSILSIIGGTIPTWSINAIPNTSAVTPTAPTSYTLNAVDFNGCASDIFFYVDINSNCDVIVYNGFTPNGDGVNDNFVIDNIDKYPNNKVQIFNRWGNKIYNTVNYNNISNRWDGRTNNGQAVTSGTYFYIILDETEKILQKGWIEITN